MKKDNMTTSSSNPYLQSKLLWNDLYGSLESKLKYAYFLVLALSVVIIFSIIGLVTIAHQSKIKPYIAVLHDQQLLTLQALEVQKSKEWSSKLALLLGPQFIEKARAFSTDAGVNQQHYLDTLSVVIGNALPVLKEWHSTIMNENETKHIAITSILQPTQNTLDIRWQEEIRNSANGELLRTEHYSAELSYRFDQVSTNDLMARHNPLGFYVTSLTWGKDKS